MLSDLEIASICEAEIRNANSMGGELAQERAAALEYYHAEPYGDEMEGRSQVVTTEVRDTVQSILPSLMRIFRDADNIFSFDPVGPEDEDSAEQESDRVSYAYFKQNKSFINTVSFCHDALLSKTGILKCWWDESAPSERAEYKNLNEAELAQLFSDESIEREVIEFEQRGDVFDITIEEKHVNGKVRIEPVAPEDFGVNSDSRSPDAQDSDFVWHKVRKTRSQLLADGFTKKQIDSLPKGDDDEFGEERLARRNKSDETDYDRSEEMRAYWVTECYARLDVREDDNAGMWKVTLVAGKGKTTVLDKEEVDGHPFFTCTPVMQTHKFYGLSIADMVMDLQRIKSTLLRNILDNAYLANNRRSAISNLVNLDDMLTNRPGGVTRVNTDDPDVAGHIAAIQSAPLASETFGLLEYLDEMRKDRTGSGDDVAGLDAKSLANVNSSVAALAYEQARMKIEMIAESIAEIGFRPLFKRVHELLQKCQNKSEVMKLRGEWVEVNPSEWKTRENMTINIGMGVSSRERRLVALDTIIERQTLIVQAGGMGTLLSPQNVYSAMTDQADAMGVDGTKYFLDPEQVPPQQDEGPSPQDQAMMLTAQAQMGAAKAQNDRNQVEMAKAQSAERIRIAELESSQQDLAMRREIEAMKADRDALKREMDSAQAGTKAMLDAEVKVRDQEIKAAEVRLRDEQETAKREVEMYKALLASSTTLTKEQMQIANSGDPQREVSSLEDKFAQMVQAAMGSVSESMLKVVDSMAGEFGEIKARLLEQSESAKAPRVIKRDAKGLIVAIGDTPVKRDASGRVEQLG